MNNLYDIAVFFIGDVPSHLDFLYGFMTLALAVVFSIVVFSPFLLAIKLIRFK